MRDEESEQRRGADVEDERTIPRFRPPHADYYGAVFNYEDEPPDMQRRVPYGCAWCLLSALLCVVGVVAWLMT